MPKVAITYGDFDCLGRDHFHLIKEMRKVVLPDNLLVVVIPDNYPAFVNKGYFPVQSLQHRIDNLSYLVKNVRTSFASDPSMIFEEHIADAKKLGDRLIYVGYDDDKDFPGRQTLSKHNIPIRFIKRPKLCAQDKD